MFKIPFTKYQGAGNDFVLMDLRHANPLSDPAAFARRVCERRRGIGADGLLLLLPSSIAHYRMRIFNADGSEPSMCGNGIRCIVDFIQKCENLSELCIETLSGVLSCRKLNNEIAVNLGAPKVLHWPIQTAEGPVYVVDTGVPHAVLFVDHLDAVDIESIGPKIRSDIRFAPCGVNVNFACVRADGKVALRTFERGVEGETLACGTGAAAVAYTAFKQFKLSSPISILTRCSFVSQPIQYREQIQFLFSQNDRGETEIEMLGSAEAVFEGTIDLKERFLVPT